jgi:hypothetical protein
MMILFLQTVAPVNITCSMHKKQNKSFKQSGFAKIAVVPSIQERATQNITP